MTNVHVIGPVLRNHDDDRLVRLGDQQILLSALYEQLRTDTRFTALIPETDDELDAATPHELFLAMQSRIANADQVVWVYHKEAAGATEAGIAVAAGKPLHILATQDDLPRIVRGLPGTFISKDVGTFCESIASTITLNIGVPA
jgi:hypothetical protein